MDVDAAPAADEEKPKKKKSKAEVRLPEIIPSSWAVEYGC
jgi:hypothetical protein